ncbi:MAG: RHS repeat protein, partial [Tabrizicola sp.]|nr:RHS repeat protein [Tabrizicola sp.]
EIRDHNGNKTTFSYDALGRRISLTDPDTGVWTWVYDRNGNVTFQDGPRTTDTLTYEYDLLNRLKTLTRNSSGTFKTFSYDSATNGLGRFWKEWEGNEAFGVVENTPLRTRGGSAGLSYVLENGFFGVSGTP